MSDQNEKVVPGNNWVGVKHPDVEVKLAGEDGNVFAIIGAVSKALRKAGYKDDAEMYKIKCFNAGSYNDVLQISMSYVEVS